MMPRRILHAYLGILVVHFATTTVIVLLGWDHPVSLALTWPTWALVVAAGVTVGAGKLSLSTAALLSLPFSAIWFGYGLLMFAFGWGSVSPTWSSEETSRMFQGFLAASAFFAIIGAALTVAGAIGARIFLRFRRSTDAA
jgi:hypothetical protein